MIGEETWSKGRQTALSFFKDSDLSAFKKVPAIIEIYKTAKEKGIAVYLVGGALRNIALKSPLVPDYDFILVGDASYFSGLVARRVHGTSFLLDKETSSYRVVIKPPNVGAPAFTLDFSPIKDGRLIYDLKKRDFTINAMAVKLADIFETERPPIIDPCKGLEDAKERILKAASSGVFRDDPLRILRAVRLSQQYGLVLAERTLRLIRESSGLLKKTSAERVRDELVLIFLNPGTQESLKFLFDCDAAKAVLPGLENWENIDGYNLLSHALKTVQEAEALLNDICAGRWAKSAIKDHFKGSVGSINRSAFFKMASFFHDIGKPLVAAREDGRLRFIGHDFEGGGIAKDLLRGLKFSRKVTAAISNLIKNHHRVFTIASLKERTSRSKAHFFRASEGEGGEWEGAGVDLICLALADARATRGGEDRKLLKTANELLDFYYGTYIKKKSRPLLSGNEIMKIFGIPEGRLVGEAIKRIAEGVEKGVIKNRKEAIVYIKNWLSLKALEHNFQ